MNRPFGGSDVLTPVDMPNIPDPIPGTFEYMCAEVRDTSTYSITAMPWLPQLPEVWAHDLHDRIETAERSYAAPNLLADEYIVGTAQVPDEVAVIESDHTPGFLFSAEHATAPSTRKDGAETYPDAGTGGLAVVLAEDYGKALVLRGRQEHSFQSNPDHPMRSLLEQAVVQADGFVSVHGKGPGMYVHPDDRAEIHACIGLGPEPSEAMHDFARKIVRAAYDDLGLYVVISNDQPAYIQKPGSTELKRRKDDPTQAKLSRLAALGPNFTTNVSRRALAAADRNIPAFQIELTNLLRLTPLDGVQKDRTSRIIGVAMGYKLLEKVVTLGGLEPLESVANS
jgi:hypothetical protein